MYDIYTKEAIIAYLKNKRFITTTNNIDESILVDTILCYFPYLEKDAPESQTQTSKFLEAFCEQKCKKYLFRPRFKQSEVEKVIQQKPIYDPIKHPYSGKEYQQQKEAFYHSQEWRTLRFQVLKEQQGRCCLCGRTAKDGIILHIDHIIPLSKDWSKRLNKDNLQVLCEDCNLGKSNTDETDWR